MKNFSKKINESLTYGIHTDGETRLLIAKRVRSLIREIVQEAVGEEIEHFIDEKGRYIGKENYHNKYRSEILSNVEEII